jgi:hypothetical protein
MKRVLIVRENQASFWQTEELECPCCHQPTRREFEQPDMFRPEIGHIKTDCLNPHCPAYYMTMSVETFMQQYGGTNELPTV